MDENIFLDNNVQESVEYTEDNIRHLNDMEHMDSVEWWDSEKADAEKILAMVDDEPKYVKDFVFNMLNEVFTLLYAIYKERKYE